MGKTRQHFRVSCVSHNIPTGKSLYGRREFLTRKLEAGNITPAEMQELAELNIKALGCKRKQPKSVVTIVFNKETTVSINEFKEYYEPLNFKVIKYIY